MKQFFLILLISTAISCKENKNGNISSQNEPRKIEMADSLVTKSEEKKSDITKKIPFNISKRQQSIVDRLRIGWQNGETIYVENTLNWSKAQWLYFIEIIEEDVDTFELKRYNAAFMLSRHKEMEIVEAWENLLDRKSKMIQ